LIGKWHLGTLNTISAAGFDYVISKASGITTSMYNTSIFDNGKSYKVYEPISDFWAQKASDYIANHSTAAKPFFLTLSLTGPYWGPLPNVGPDPKNPFYNYYYNLPEFKSFPRTSINGNVLDQLSGKVPTDISDFPIPEFKGLSENQIVTKGLLVFSLFVLKQNLKETYYAAKTNSTCKWHNVTLNSAHFLYYFLFFLAVVCMSLLLLSRYLSIALLMNRLLAISPRL
jgi:Sulfatase